MADDGNGKVVINVATGHEDAERVLIAFLVATGATARGNDARVHAQYRAGAGDSLARIKAVWDPENVFRAVGNVAA